MINSYIKSGNYPEHESLGNFYEDYLPFMYDAMGKVLSLIETDRESVEHIKSRIKSPESMSSKLERKHEKANVENALTKVYDACGVRVVCAFLNDVFEIVDAIKKDRSLEIWDEKNYIQNPKPNGYRSYHMILLVPVETQNETIKIFVEIQIRTIAMDCWASLEHQLKYKQEIPNQALFIEELKRCSSEMASTDLNLQTLRDMIDSEKQNTG